ncbi:MAG: cytochrome c [Gammaproteobacteria bacterium]|nr:cytochrome c [Gammaproteobacteria bacterium]
MKTAIPRFAICFVSGILLPVLIASAGEVANPASGGSGRSLYADYCAQCHGANRRGLNAFSGDRAALVARLSGASEGMPDFTGFFGDEEITALFEYLAATDLEGN